jgi:hypothetical protein
VSRWLVRVWWVEREYGSTETEAGLTSRLREFSAEPLEPTHVIDDGTDALRVGMSLVVGGRTAKVAVITALAALEGAAGGVHPVALQADAL